MKPLITMLILLLSLSISPSFADAEISDEKQALIDTLLKQIGHSDDEISNQIITSYLQQITSVIKQSEPDISPATQQEIAITVSMAVKQHIVEQELYKAPSMIATSPSKSYKRSLSLTKQLLVKTIECCAISFQSASTCFQ